MRKANIIFIIFFLIPITHLLLAQGGVWRTFTNANNVNSMIERGGVLWCATGGGGIRFDISGNSFTKYTNAESLAGNNLRAVGINEQKGEIWFGTQGDGVSRYEPFLNRWVSYTSFDGLTDSNTVLSIHADESGILWFGTPEGLSRFNDSGTIDKNDDDWWKISTRDGLAGTHVRSIGRNGDTLWFATKNGVSRAIRINFPPYLRDFVNYLSGIEIKSIVIESGSVWAGTGGAGIYRFNGMTWISYNNGLPSLDIRSLSKKDTVFWAGTSSGMARFRISDSTWIVENNGLPSLDVNCVVIDENNIPWCGIGGESFSFDGGGIAKFYNGTWINYRSDGPGHNWIDHVAFGCGGDLWVSHGPYGEGASYISKNGKWNRELTTPGKLEYGWVSGIICDKSGDVWLGTWSGGETLGGVYRLRPDSSWIHYNPNNTNYGLKTPNIIDCWMDTAGNRYFGTWNISVSMFPKDESGWRNYIYSGLKFMRVRSVLSYNPDFLWIGTEDGLLKYERRNGQDFWTSYNIANSSILDNFIWDIASDEKGNLWLATQGGVNFFDGRNFVGYTIQNSPILSNFCVSVRLDRRGWVWIGTDKGVSVFDPVMKKWMSYQKEIGGLVSNRIRWWGIKIRPRNANQDEIWIGTEEGLSLFVPTNIPPSNFSKIFVYPNPFFNDGSNVVTFSELPDNSVVRIFTISGEIVKTLRNINTASHSVQWDGKNEEGRSVSSGLFPFVIVSPGIGNKVGTLAILK